LGANAIILNDVYLQNVDITGRMVVGNNATFPNYTVGSELPYDPSRYDLIVGGDLDHRGGSVPNGAVAYGGNLINTATAAGGYHLDTPIDMAQLTNDMNWWSQELATQTPNGAGTNGTFTCPSGVDPCVINATASDVDQQISVNAEAGTTVLINVSGNDISMWNFGMFYSGGVQRDTVIYNFYEAENISMGGIGFEGSILAPRADLYFINGQMNGQIVVDNWIVSDATGGEMHHRLFNGCPWICV
jgi:choice-of-anchor A domain-containing protein